MAGLNSEFSFNTSCLTKAKEPSLPYYLFVADGERKDGFIPFLRAMAQDETHIALSRVWTRLTDSISYGDNRYSKCTI